MKQSSRLLGTYIIVGRDNKLHTQKVNISGADNCCARKIKQDKREYRMTKMLVIIYMMVKKGLSDKVTFSRDLKEVSK